LLHNHSIYTFFDIKKIPQHQKKRRVCKDERNEKKTILIKIILPIIVINKSLTRNNEKDKYDLLDDRISNFIIKKKNHLIYLKFHNRHPTLKCYFWREEINAER
jgi:hypothetical protein